MVSSQSPSLFQKPEVRFTLVLLLLSCLLSVTGAFDGIEVKTLDWRFHHRPASLPDRRIVMLYVSDECLAEIGKWPWSRNVHARVVQELRRMGIAGLVVDILFQETSDQEPEADQKLVDACRELGRTVLPMCVIPVNVVHPETGQLSTTFEVMPPFVALASSAVAMGSINVDYRHLNPDGVIRRLPLYTRIGDAWYPSLALAAAHGLTKMPLRLDEQGLFLGTMSVPLHEYPILESTSWYWHLISRPALLVNYQGEADSGAFPIVYVSDLLRGAVAPEFLRDKIVLYGPSAIGLADIKLTPYGEMPGVMIHANILQNLLNQTFLYQPGPLMQMLMLALPAVLVLLILLMLGNISGLAALIALITAWLVLAMQSFVRLQYVIDMVLPVSMMIVQFSLIRFMQMYWSMQEAYSSLQQRTVDLEQSNRTLDQQVRDLSQLNVAGNRFSTTLEIDSLCREVMETYRTLWESPVCVISVYDQDSEQMQLLRQLGGASDEEVRLTLYDPGLVKCLQRAIDSRQVVVDVTACRWYNCYVPLPLGSRVWGAILLNSARPREMLEGRENFWATLSGLAATALENSRLYNLATVDTLTKMYVRRYLQVTIDQEFKRARRFQHAISVLMIDIDQFKSFNDTFGHQQGDLVLREVAQVVRRSLRDIDIAARYGGEEFCVVLPETNADGALIVAERIRRNVELLCVPRLSSPGEPLRVTVSIGGVSFPELQAESADQMIKMADTALYDAKNAGRNRTIISGGRGSTMIDPLIPSPSRLEDPLAADNDANDLPPNPR